MITIMVNTIRNYIDISNSINIVSSSNTVSCILRPLYVLPGGPRFSN